MIRVLISTLVIIAFFAILVSSCQPGKSNSVANSTANVKLVAFNQNSLPDESLADNYQLDIKTLGEDKLVTVSLKSAHNLDYSYLELQFPDTSVTKDFTNGDGVSGALTFSAQYKPGAAIVVVVVPAGREKLTGNAELVSFRLTPGTFRAVSSVTSQDAKDPVIQNQILDSGVLSWTEVLRGDANANQIIDFADFGTIGAKYNQTPGASNEPWDPNNNGKVDFADFGVIGAGYNQKVLGFSIYSGSKLVKTISKDGSFAPEIKGTTGSRGWPVFQYVVDWAEVEPITIKTISEYNTAYSITKISASQENLYTSAVIELTLSTSGTIPDINTAYWMTDSGSFTTAPPAAWHSVRESSAVADTYTGAKAYLKLPATAGTVKVTALLGEAAKSQSFSVASSIVTLSSASDGFGNTIVTAKANNVSNLYQIAFRVYYDTSVYKKTAISQGSFLGSASSTLFIGHEFKAGQIACSITKRGEVAGASGSGNLATITLTPVKSGSEVNRQPAVWVELDSARTNDGREVSVK